MAVAGGASIKSKFSQSIPMASNCKTYQRKGKLAHRNLIQFKISQSLQLYKKPTVAVILLRRISGNVLVAIELYSSCV